MLKKLIAIALLAPSLVMAAPEVVISLADKHLYVIEDGEELASYPVGVGKPTTPTPAGEFTITSIVKNPPLDCSCVHPQGQEPAQAEGGASRA